MALLDKDLKIISEAIRDIPDFPKEGIVFKDITTLLNNPKAFKVLLDHFEDRYKEYDLDYIAGIDSRGFIFGTPLADRLGIGFVPIRKKGKLPSKTWTQKYELEYGFDEIEIHTDAFCNKKDARVLLIDDLIATGGTASAAQKLIEQTGAICVESCFVINLTFLDGAKKLKGNVYSLLNI